MHIYIRQETKADHDSVFQLIQSAFKEEEFSAYLFRTYLYASNTLLNPDLIPRF